MALNKAVFKTRALSALIFVAVMLVGLLWNFWSFFILFSIIHFGCWVEYQKIISLIDPKYLSINKIHKYGIMILGWSIMLLFANENYKIGNVSLHQIGFWLAFISSISLLINEIIFFKNIQIKNLGYSFAGLIYISLSWALLTHLRSHFNLFDSEIGEYIVLIIIGAIWINDTMAYIVGSFIGKTPLTKISPKKTWEGTIGGIILAVITISIIGFFIVKKDVAGALSFGVIAAIVAIAGTFGDILESKLKRMANIKDSGSILPGHGGFLDRFDSLLIATPFVWLLIVLAFK